MKAYIQLSFIFLIITPFLPAHAVKADVAAQPVEVEIIKNADLSVLEIIFKQNSKIIARKKFRKGKIVSTEGSICEIVEDAKVVETEGFPIKSNDEANWSVKYVYKGEVLAVRERQNGGFISYGDIPDGLIVEFYNNRKIRNIYFNKDGTKNGIAISFYSNGNLKSYNYFENGSPVGEGKRFFESGDIAEEWN